MPQLGHFITRFTYRGFVNDPGAAQGGSTGNEEPMKAQEKYCSGCRDDYYNHGGNGFNGGKCWSLKDATVVTRYQLHWWTAPTVPGAFTKVQTNLCHHAPGKYAFYKELPTFAVARETTGRGK